MRGAFFASTLRSKREIVSQPPPLPPTDGPVPAQPVVTAAAGGAGQLSATWLRPTTKADGSTLSSGEITRYWLYVSDVPGEANPEGAYDQRLEVTAPTLTRTVTGLAADTYYLAVSCESTYGESEASFEYEVVVT